MKKIIILLALLFSHCLFASSSVRITDLSGDVKVRRGLDEHWQLARTGMVLETIDTILTGEKSRVKLALAEANNFILGANAILDIADLRRISRKELFLLITSEKIEKLPQRKSGGQLRISNVNVLHGEKKDSVVEKVTNPLLEQAWQQHRNGGIDLLEQKYYTNAIVKFHKTLKTYVEVKDCGEIYYFLGQAFERLENEGQALEAYSNSIKMNFASECIDEQSLFRREKTEKAIMRLKR
ncbi:MAG: hypothetical protein DWQ05_12655 [Calditrichaeota bacterium]|nr:MAG: hypothetical protein DWQ05_12655 [Calditrichota bacterium]